MQRRSAGGMGALDLQPSFLITGATILNKCSNLSGDILMYLKKESLC